MSEEQEPLLSVVEAREARRPNTGNTFVKLPIQRGFEEIRPIWDVINHDEVVICGGYARYCASTRPKPIKAGDLDLFPKTENAADNLAKLLAEMGFEIRHENEVSVTFKKNDKYPTLPVLQVIKPVDEGAIKTIGTLEEVLSNFDFTVVRVAIISETEVLADADFEHDESFRLLRFKNIHCPISSLIRTQKYGRKGYYMRPAEAIKLFIDWDERDDEYRSNMVRLFQSSAFGEMTQEEVDQLERLLRID